MKYYEPEHIKGYKRAKAEGKTAWNELHGMEGFDNFSSRTFLEAVLPQLRFDSEHPSVLDYGCGTGPDACFLAERGFRVDAIDLVPAAIDMARQIAAERGLDINFQVQDVCELPPDGKQYDMVVDSFCLQCLVFDDERQRVFSAVRGRLKPRGYYLISTALMDEEHEAFIRRDEPLTDPATGMVYHRYYSEEIIDLDSGAVYLLAVYVSSDASPDEFPRMIQIDGQWYLPHRRHLRPDALVAELERAGFSVIHRFPDHPGSLACAPLPQKGC